MKKLCFSLCAVFALGAQAQMTPAQAHYQQQQHVMQQQLYGQLAHDEAMRRRAEAAATSRPYNVCDDKPGLCATWAKHNRYGAVVVRSLPDNTIIWHQDDDDLFFYTADTVDGGAYGNNRVDAVQQALNNCEQSPANGAGGSECFVLFAFTNMDFAIAAGMLPNDAGVRFYFSTPSQEDLARQRGMNNLQAAQAFFQDTVDPAAQALAQCQSDPAVVSCAPWTQRRATVGNYVPGSVHGNPGLDPQFR